MGILEDLYIKARSRLYGIGKTAGRYLDISKLKIKVAECEKDIEIKYQKIGEIVYNKVESNEIFDTMDVSELINDINNLKEDMRGYMEKINSLKGKRACKFCNSLNNAGSQFCSTCGNSLNYADSSSNQSTGVVIDKEDYSTETTDDEPAGNSVDFNE